MLSMMSGTMCHMQSATSTPTSSSICVSLQYEEIISSNSDSRYATSMSMKQPPSYLQCAIPQVCHRNEYTPVSSIHVLPMIIDQSVPMCQKWLSLSLTHAQVLPPRHHHRCNSITPKCLISILHIKSLFQAIPIHVLESMHPILHQSP